MELKPQDLLVLFKVAAHPGQRWTYAALGEALTLSASEAHASVKRAVAAGLAVMRGRGDLSPLRPALRRFSQRVVPRVPVMSFDELVPPFTITDLGAVRVAAQN